MEQSFMEDLPENIRAFAAIYPGRDIALALEKMQTQLRSKISGDAIRWTAPEQIHVTLSFLGNIETRRVPEFASAIQSALADSSRFTLHVQAIGCFPTVRRPRVVWAGLSGELDALRVLKQRLDLAMSELGIIAEDREFRPHLTIGRVRQMRFQESQRVGNLLRDLQSISFGEWTVGKIDFMRSTLSARGATYSLIESFEF